MSNENEDSVKPGKTAGKPETSAKKSGPVGAIQTLPCLYPGRDNNYFTFKAAMHIHAITTYGDIGKIFELNTYPTFTRPPLPQALAGVETRNNYTIEKEMAAAEYKTDLQTHLGKVVDFEKKKLPLFGCIFGQLSEASRDKLSKEATWDAVMAGYDPLALWKLITATHLVHNSGVKASDKAYERTAYGMLKMRDTDTLSGFATLFKNAHKRMVAVGMEPMGEADKAADFLNKLNEKQFGRMRATLLENEMQGIGQYPATYEDAYTLAQRWSTTDHYTEEVAPEGADIGSAYVTNGGEPERKGKQHGARGAGRGTSAGDKNSEKIGDKKGPSACYVCREMHRVKDCPYLEEFSDWVKLMKADKERQKKKPKDDEHAKVTYDEEEEDDDDNEYFSTHRW